MSKTDIQQHNSDLHIQMSSHANVDRHVQEEFFRRRMILEVIALYLDRIQRSLDKITLILNNKESKTMSERQLNEGSVEITKGYQNDEEYKSDLTDRERKDGKKKGKEYNSKLIQRAESDIRKINAYLRKDTFTTAGTKSQRKRIVKKLNKAIDKCKEQKCDDELESAYDYTHDLAGSIVLFDEESVNDDDYSKLLKTTQDDIKNNCITVNRSKNRLLKDRINELENKNSKLESKVSKLENTVLELKDEIKVLNNTVSDLKKQNEALNNTVLDVNNKMGFLVNFIIKSNPKLANELLKDNGSHQPNVAKGNELADRGLQNDKVDGVSNRDQPNPAKSNELARKEPPIDRLDGGTYKIEDSLAPVGNAIAFEISKEISKLAGKQG